jgi:hypothetical protein
MSDKVVIQKEDFPEWLKESEFYLDLEEGEFEVETWLLLKEPGFDTVENIMHFLRIVNYCNIDMSLYMQKIRDFMKDNVNYFSLISHLYSKNYGVYKEVLEEFEGPLFKIDVEGRVYIDEDDEIFGYLNIDLKIIIRHRNMKMFFNMKEQIEYEIDVKEKTHEDFIDDFLEGFTLVGDLLSNKLETSLLKEWAKFKVEMKDKLKRQEYLDVLKEYKRKHNLKEISSVLTLNEKYNMISVELNHFNYQDNIFFLQDDDKIGFYTIRDIGAGICNSDPVFFKIHDLEVVKDEFYSVKGKILKLLRN